MINHHHHRFLGRREQTIAFTRKEFSKWILPDALRAQIKLKVKASPQCRNRLMSACMMIASVFKWSVFMHFLSSFLRCYLSFENVNTSKQNRENSFTIISFASTMNIEKEKKKKKKIYRTVTIFYFFLLCLPTVADRSERKKISICAYADGPSLIRLVSSVSLSASVLDMLVWVCT